MIDTLLWRFPLPRTHTGVPLGNGRTGLIVWGEGATLCITIGRADLWDHRGGMPWTDRQNYADIRAALERGDEAAIRSIFRPSTEGVPGQPPRPCVLPLGRIEIDLAEGWRLEDAVLDLRRGAVRVSCARTATAGAGAAAVDPLTDGRPAAARDSIEIALHPTHDVAWVRHGVPLAVIRPVPSWDLMGERLAALSFAPPERFGDPGRGAPGDRRPSDRIPCDRTPCGWYWPLPADPGVVVGWSTAEPGLTLLAVSRTPADATAAEARDLIGRALAERPVVALEDTALGFWERYWRRVPDVTLPNPELQELHDYGLYCLAGLTNPAGVAATLQGPWIEEYDFPPWSSDYHFNINVQMCYSPAYRAGLFDHLVPLFDLVWSWRDQLARNARTFIGVDGYMLPHAVDDRCTCMGSFWTGTIDHACTAWVAQMMFDYADYSGDLAFLRDRALPFMKGAYAVYRAMLEEDGERLRLPVSVSPEYRGSSMDAWGANASFQLAAVHRLCENLAAASAALGEAADPDWAEVSRRLPSACLADVGGPDARILLWEGVDLEESHRHQSHLAGITPFGTIDPFDPAWRPVVERSIRTWISRGMGYWSGWCMPWASGIHSYLHNGDGAELLLELWKRVFTNEGRGSLHDAVCNGLTLMGAPPVLPEEPAVGAASTGDRDSAGPSSRGSTGTAILAQTERMQMDGRMGAVTAVQDMLLHSRRGVIQVFPGVPDRWRACSFTGLRAPGGHLVSAWLAGDSFRVTVTATRDGRVRVEPPGPVTAAALAGSPCAAETDGRVSAWTLAAGDRLEIAGVRSSAGLSAR